MYFIIENPPFNNYINRIPMQSKGQCFLEFEKVKSNARELSYFFEIENTYKNTFIQCRGGFYE